MRDDDIVLVNVVVFVVVGFYAPQKQTGHRS